MLIRAVAANTDLPQCWETEPSCCLRWSRLCMSLSCVLAWPPETSASRAPRLPSDTLGSPAGRGQCLGGQQRTGGAAPAEDTCWPVTGLFPKLCSFLDVKQGQHIPQQKRPGPTLPFQPTVLSSSCCAGLSCVYLDLSEGPSNSIPFL